MSDIRPAEIDVVVATRIVKLINDVDAWIRALRKIVNGRTPWERALIPLLGDADRCMQILRMTEAMQKPDRVIAEAAVDLAAACRRMELAIQGSRADAFVRSSVQGVGKVGTALAQMVLDASSSDTSGPSTGR